MDEHDKRDLRAIGARLKTEFALAQPALPRDMEELLALLHSIETVPTKPELAQELV